MKEEDIMVRSDVDGINKVLNSNMAFIKVGPHLHKGKIERYYLIDNI